MPEHIRALIVLLTLAIIVFAMGKRQACTRAIIEVDYIRRRNLWFGITLSAFLAHNFWIYLILTSIMLLWGAKQERNKLSLYFFLFFTVPQIRDTIFIFGIYFFHIHYGHLLSLLVLLPAAIELHKGSTLNGKKSDYSLQDIILVVYLTLLFLLHHHAETVGDIFRYYIYFPFIEVFLPYYVASRALKTIQDFRDALMSFVMACLVLSVIAIFEFGRHWLLYTALQAALGTPWDYGKYLSRGAFLRALATPGQAIALGYVLAVAFGILLYFRNLVGNPVVWRIGMVTLIAGLIAALSRGPWIGAVVMIGVFIISGPRATSNIVKMFCFALLLLFIAAGTPAWNEIVEYLPFVGSVDSENVEFRRNLLDGVVNIILKNPLLGSSGADLEQFRTGEGIIDIVNTYLNIGLESGLTGLGLFIAFFLTICFGIFKGMGRLSSKTDEKYFLGRTLLAVIVGIMLIIFTVSSVTVIPYVYWAMAGVGVAYIRLVAQTTTQEKV